MLLEISDILINTDYHTGERDKFPDHCLFHSAHLLVIAGVPQEYAYDIKRLAMLCYTRTVTSFAGWQFE